MIKDLQITLLKEKLEKLTGKKVSLQEASIVTDKDWDRMLALKLAKDDGSRLANSITDKDKAIARFIAGSKLAGENLKYNPDWKSYSGSFSALGDKALKLGATTEEIQNIFNSTIIPDKYTDKENSLKGKKLDNRFVKELSKAILDAGFDITYLPTNGNALTQTGRDAMSRNGRKWTIGYKTEISYGDKKTNFDFDAITDEGDGPTYFVVNNYGEPMGKREFISDTLTKLNKLKI